MSSLAFYAYEANLSDTNAIRQGPKPVQLSRLRLKLVSENEMTESWIGLPLTKVRAIQPDGSVLLHLEDYIPPVTGYAASSLLSEWLMHLNGLVKMRADMLAKRLSNSDGKASASAEIVDYLLLQIFNKYEPILDHLRNIPELPPIMLYQELAKFSGELSTFIRTKTRRSRPAPGYDHGKLYSSIRPLVDDVHELLNQILVRAGQMILDLKEMVCGQPLCCLTNTFILQSGIGCSCAITNGCITAPFSVQTKISAPQQLHELVRSHLPGLELQRLPVPPRQIPYSAGYVYF